MHGLVCTSPPAHSLYWQAANYQVSYDSVIVEDLSAAVNEIRLKCDDRWRLFDILLFVFIIDLNKILEHVFRLQTLH